MAFLNAKDDLTRMIMQGIAFEARELQRQQDLERAQLIAQQISKLFGG